MALCARQPVVIRPRSAEDEQAFGVVLLLFVAERLVSFHGA